MKRAIPHSLLLLIAVVLDRVAISTIQINLAQSLRPLIILFILTSLAIALIQRIVRDWHYTNFIVLMIWAILLLYRSLYGFLKINFLREADYLALALIPALGGIYAIVVSRKVWQSVRNPAQITAYFNLVFIVLLGFQVVRLNQDAYHLFKNTINPQTTAITPFGRDIKLKKESLLDIYVIILDGYGRQDVLQNIYHHNNSEFIGSLEKRGFYVADGSHSNYIQTLYTMASFWNLDYLQTWDSSYEYAQYLSEPIQNNLVFGLLDEIGYTTVSFEQAAYFAEIKNSDIYLSNFLPLNHFERLLLVDSPVESLSSVFDLKIPLYTYKTHRQRMLYQLDTLKDIPANISGPKIVYTHILAPHPPFVFSQHGDFREPQQPFTLAEGTEGHGGVEAYWYGYREQVSFLNTEIIEVVDAILAKSETQPIILIMGDHGPASMFNWDFNDPGCLWERTSNLYALLLPGHQNDRTLYSSISPVNSFRVIFNTYFGTDLPLLEDKTYHTSWQQPTLMLDVTDKTDSMKGCTMPALEELSIKSFDMANGFGKVIR